MILLRQPYRDNIPLITAIEERLNSILIFNVFDKKIGSNKYIYAFECNLFRQMFVKISMTL